MPSPTMDEKERKTKTEALKQLLMNAQAAPHPAAQAAPYTSDTTNPFNARAPKFQSPIPRLHSTRHHSGPSTPTPPFTSSGPYRYFPDQLPIAHGPRTTGSPVHRPASSHLRRQYQVQDHESPVELSSDNNGTTPPISTARNAIERPQSPYHSNNTNSTALPRTGQNPNHKSSRSAQQLEDDLRRSSLARPHQQRLRPLFTSNYGWECLLINGLSLTNPISQRMVERLESFV